MKKMVFAFALLMGVLSQSAVASTLTWTATPFVPVGYTSGVSGPGELITGDFTRGDGGADIGPLTHSWTFSSSLAFNITGSGFNFVVEATDILVDIASVKLDGVDWVQAAAGALSIWNPPGLALVGAGSHTLDIALNSIAKGGHYDITLDSQEGADKIPLPGAALLFGSALLGVGGLGRKKKSLSQGVAA